jgi:hypothetical protein
MVASQWLNAEDSVVFPSYSMNRANRAIVNAVSHSMYVGVGCRVASDQPKEDALTRRARRMEEWLVSIEEKGKRRAFTRVVCSASRSEKVECRVLHA